MEIEKLSKCNGCPRKCNVNRNNGEIGFCKACQKVNISLVSKHKWEEPCISGKEGSGTVFFSGCNMRCVYCQNYKISRDITGRDVSIEELADIFLEIQLKGANNINLVSPTIYVYQIKEAILIARKKGLKIPIIYNSNGYENVENIKKLDGLIDVYLPDFKYFSDNLAKKYSLTDDYVEKVKDTLIEMKRQVKNPVLDENGMIKSGLIIRHLILPNNMLNTKLVLKWIVDNLGEDTWVSIMAQYFPCGDLREMSELNRKITKEELDSVEKYLKNVGLNSGYIQSLEDNEEKYIPDF